jgi:hypothetical protein
VTSPDQPDRLAGRQEVEQHPNLAQGVSVLLLDGPAPVCESALRNEHQVVEEHGLERLQRGVERGFCVIRTISPLDRLGAGSCDRLRITQDLLDPTHGVLAELDVGRGQCLIDVVGIAGSDDRHVYGGVGQRPGDGQLP